ncbi:hypothetical protein [Salmonella enterica]
MKHSKGYIFEAKDD